MASSTRFDGAGSLPVLRQLLRARLGLVAFVALIAQGGSLPTLAAGGTAALDWFC